MKHQRTKPPARGDAGKKAVNRYPRGLNRAKVQAIVAHYDNQTDDAAIAEDEAAYNTVTTTMMSVPVELVAKVQKLIAKRSG